MVMGLWMFCHNALLEFVCDMQVRPCDDDDDDDDYARNQNFLVQEKNKDERKLSFETLKREMCICIQPSMMEDEEQKKGNRK